MLTIIAVIIGLALLPTVFYVVFWLITILIAIPFWLVEKIVEADEETGFNEPVKQTAQVEALKPPKPPEHTWVSLAVIVVGGSLLLGVAAICNWQAGLAKERQEWQSRIDKTMPVMQEKIKLYRNPSH